PAPATGPPTPTTVSAPTASTPPGSLPSATTAGSTTSAPAALRRNPRPAPGPGPAHPRHQRRHRRAPARAHPRPDQELPAHRPPIRLAKENTTTLTRVRGVLDVLRHHIGAGEGNRTLMTSLEGWGSAIELRPHRPSQP